MKKYLHSLLFVVLTGAAINAHALCMNPDGSLDDASVLLDDTSVPSDLIATDVLPACLDQEKKDTAEKPRGKQNNTES